MSKTHITTVRLDDTTHANMLAMLDGNSASNFIRQLIAAEYARRQQPAAPSAQPVAPHDIQQQVDALRRQLEALAAHVGASLSASGIEPETPEANGLASDPISPPAAPAPDSQPDAVAAYPKPPKGGTPPAALARLISLKDMGASHVYCAAALNAEGFKRGTGIEWDAQAVGVQWKKEQQRRSRKQ